MIEGFNYAVHRALVHKAEKSENAGVALSLPLTFRFCTLFSVLLCIVHFTSVAIIVFMIAFSTSDFIVSGVSFARHIFPFPELICLSVSRLH